MMRKRLISVAVISTTLAATVASASIQPYPCAWYLEGNYGESRVSGVNTQGSAEGKGNGAGWGINGGYKFSPNIAAEAGYTDYAAIHLQNAAGSTFAKDKAYSIQAAAKGIWPFGTTSFDVFGKLGIAYVHSSVNIEAIGIDSSSSDNTSEGLYIGAGVEYALAHELLINLQFERAYGNSHTGKLDLLSLGVALMFA